MRASSVEEIDRAERPEGWGEKRSWLVRALIWLYLAHVGVSQHREPGSYVSVFCAINMCIHEGGHLLFRPFGELLHVAGGTVAQLAAPIISMVILVRQAEYFGISFCLGWLSTNLVEVGVYMADARAMERPLVSAEAAGSPNAIPIHDWNYLFGRFGLLPQDQTIGLATRDVGSFTMILALVIGAWLIGAMIWANLRSDSPRSRVKPAPRKRPSL